MSTDTQTPYSTTDPELLLSIVDPTTGVFNCVGWAPSQGRRCRNPIACHNRESAHRILRYLPQVYDDEQSLRVKLKALATLALCRRYHQGQAPEVANRWYRAIATEPRKRDSTSVTVDDLEEEILRRQREIDELRQRQQQYRRRDEERGRQDGDPEEDYRKQAGTRCQEERRQEERRQKERRQEERRQKERRQEERRQEERRQEERRREERRQEEARREQEEADRRRDEARQEREARRRAAAQARAVRERQQREKSNREWLESWTRYERDWDHMQHLNTTALDEAVRESVPWPVKSGQWRDVDEVNVRMFLRHAPDEASENPRKFRSLLRRQAMRWHEDRLRHFFPRVAKDEECLRIATLVQQVVNDLTGALPSL